MINRRTVSVYFIGAVAGCGHRLSNLDEYEEHVNSLAITPSGNQLVILGSLFHYIFQPPISLVSVLQSDLRQLLTADFRAFELESSTKIRGQWILVLAQKKLSSEQISSALSFGFRRDERGRYVLQGSIAGTRFRKSQLEEVAGATKTNQTYHIRVKPSTSYVRESSLQSSPVRNNSDGLLIIGLIVLLPLLLLVNPCLTCK